MDEWEFAVSRSPDNVACRQCVRGLEAGLRPMSWGEYFPAISLLRHTVAASVAVVLAVLPLFGADDDSATKQDGPVWALLVGVSHYPNLTPRLQLKGPANDVNLISAVLKQRFQVPEGNIVTLTEGDDVDRLPTRVRIETEFRLLAERVQPGDQVLILIAGHGSRQPDAVNGDERDGLDEIFLPRDVGAWQKMMGVVKNAITDDELHVWLESIRVKGARIFFVADTCHSGTISRGHTAVVRNVGTEVLGIPEDAIATAAQLAAQKSPLTVPGVKAQEESRAETESALEDDSGNGVVALYAAHPHESTYELELSGGTKYGWLSWALAKALNDTTNGAMTYRELVQRICWHYEQQVWTLAHPLVEAAEADLDREVLGVSRWPGRSRITLQRSSVGQLTINAGSLHKLSIGSILAAYHDGQQTPAGYIRVTEVGAVQSRVEPAEYEGSPAMSDLPVPARCELKYRDLGEYQILVTVDVSAIRDPALQMSARERMRAAVVSAAERAESLLRLPSEGRKPDWLIVAEADGEAVTLVAADQMTRDASGRLQPNGHSVHGPYRMDEHLSERLFVEFGTIARARNLRGLADLGGSGDGTANLNIRVERLVDKRGGQYSPLVGGTPKVFDKDVVRVGITNTTKSYVDVTLLYIQADARIHCFFPQELEFNRLGPDETHFVTGIEISSDPAGLEDLIVIGVPAKDGAIPASFAFLRQRGLEAAAGGQASRGSADSAWVSPLGMLMRGRMFNEPGKSRNGNREVLDSFSVYRFSWNVVK